MLVEGRAYDLHLGDTLCLSLVPLRVIPVEVKEEDDQRWDLLSVFQQPFEFENANWGVVVIVETLYEKKHINTCKERQDGIEREIGIGEPVHVHNYTRRSCALFRKQQSACSHSYTIRSTRGVDVVGWKLFVQNGSPLHSPTARRELVPDHTVDGVVQRVQPGQRYEAVGRLQQGLGELVTRDSSTGSSAFAGAIATSLCLLSCHVL